MKRQLVYSGKEAVAGAVGALTGVPSSPCAGGLPGGSGRGLAGAPASDPRAKGADPLLPVEQTLQHLFRSLSGIRGGLLSPEPPACLCALDPIWSPPPPRLLWRARAL